METFAQQIHPLHMPADILPDMNPTIPPVMHGAAQDMNQSFRCCSLSIACEHSI